MADYPGKTKFLKQLFKRNDYKPPAKDSPATEDSTLLNYYASLAMYHPNLIVVLSPDGSIISENHSSMNELLGYSPKEKPDFKNHISKQSYATLGSAFNKALKGTPQKHEIPVLTKNKETIHTVLTFVPIKQATTIEGVYLIVQDETERNQLGESLALKEKHLTHAQQIANIGSWEYIVQDDILYCSDTFYDIFGMDKSIKEPHLEKVLAYIHPDDREKTTRIIQHAIEKGIGYETECRILRNKTEVRYLKLHAEAIWLYEKSYKLVGVVKDYTEQHNLERNIKKQEKWFRHIFDHLNAGIWLTEYDTGKVTFASKGSAEILQIPQKDLYDNAFAWKDIIHPAHREEVNEQEALLQDGHTLFLKYRINCGDGTTKWLFDQTVPWFNDEGKLTHTFGMVADITPEVEMQEQLNYFSSHDTLTALPNQRSLYQELDELYEGSTEKFALLYLDLDRFKIINDSLGYQIGDEVLKRTANRLLSRLPDDSYLARISSNDFVVIVKNYSKQESIFGLAEQIIKDVEKTITVDGYELHVTTSIGISFYPEDGADKLALIESAHAALYHAKQLGKNNFQLYSASRDITSFKKYSLEKDMRKAIKNEDFELYYQPRVNPKNGVIQGAEALIRWHHDEWGLVSPGEFIPLAEENHLINEIGDWVIKNVVEQLRVWRDEEYTLRPISINVSPIRFMKKGLVELVEEQLKLHNIPAKYLEFEITESSLLKNDKNVLKTLAGLKDLGISIAIDDFGTGHASLTYLREFHADTIKIDQVFIQSIKEENKKDVAIISSILHLAKELEVNVVAEGVEEYEQLEFLIQKECAEIQGYLFSKPVPVKTFQQMLQTGYLKPSKPKRHIVPETERRAFYRLQFPNHVLGEMSIIEVKKRKVNLGSTQILIEDISLGGLKLISTLKLPINAAVKFKFSIQLMGESFEFTGTLVWKNEAKQDTFYYGIKFNLNVPDEDRLAGVINKMTVLRNLKHPIPDTQFVEENPFVYLRKNAL